LGFLHGAAQGAREEQWPERQAEEAVIPVVLAKEPVDFDAKVRQPGRSAIDELVGRVPRIKRPGPRRKKVAETEAKISADAFPPFWRDALDDMMLAYEQRCAYLAMFIEDTGNPTVDHVIPKSLAWNKVYEWSNYRLCTGVVNSKKGELLGLVDPVEAKPGWFELDLASYARSITATSPRSTSGGRASRCLRAARPLSRPRPSTRSFPRAPTRSWRRRPTSSGSSMSDAMTRSSFPFSGRHSSRPARNYRSALQTLNAPTSMAPLDWAEQRRLGLLLLAEYGPFLFDSPHSASRTAIPQPPGLLALECH